MFRSFGHLNSSVLNGGLPLWELEHGEIESERPATPQKSDYPTPILDNSVIRGRHHNLTSAVFRASRL